jgi:hypothetical protein
MPLSAADPSGDLALRGARKVHINGDIDPLTHRPPACLGGGAAGQKNAKGCQSLVEECLADPHGWGDSTDGLTGLVATDHIIKVERRDFAGHVYNLQTVGGWYSSNGIIAHNCTHAYSAYQEGFTPELKPALDDAKNAELYANNQKLRYLERKTREAKRLEAAAMDPVAARQAKAKVATYQAKIREHVNNTSVKRLTYREQIGQAH